ncbi:MAG: cysteine desulfurase [Uliginosibacterium sp.]|nr:cysteine desulfurase [Uliginosibacterium sp.]
MFAPCYLDFNATTPLHPLVLESMLPFLQGKFGNASSRHEYGRQARQAIDVARQQVAAAVNAHPTEVFFTSGGSEANNLFVKGVAGRMKPGCIAVGVSEHPCVRQPALQLRAAGWSMIELPLHEHGSLDIAEAVRLSNIHRPSLVSVMLANNETGAISSVAQLAAGIDGAWVHSDAVQALGKEAIDFRGLGVHAMTISAHKISGPNGAGALILDKRVDLQPLIAGGGQEHGLRSGTENLAAIVGFGRACEIVTQDLEQRRAAMLAARTDLEEGLLAMGATVFAQHADRLPNTSFFAVDGIDGETLVAKLDRAGFAVASGSACSSSAPEPSRSLLAMGVSPDIARCAVRVSAGATTSRTDVAAFLLTLKNTVASLKGLTAVAT